MGLEIHFTVFVATDSDLDTCFPGWRRPLGKPRQVERINPATGDAVSFLTWDPGRPARAKPPRSMRVAPRRKPLDPILPPENDEDRWIQEQETPALLKTFPHFSMKGVSWRFSDKLLAALELSDLPPARFIDCPDDEGDMLSLPEAAVAPLANLGDRELKKTLAAWQKVLGIKGKSVKLIEEEVAEGSAWCLRRIRALAIEADGCGGHLFANERAI